MKTRVITATILIAIIFPILYIGGTAFKILGLIFSAIGTYEIVRLVNKKWPKLVTVICLLLGVITSAVCLFDMSYFVIVSIFTLIILFTCIVFCPEVDMGDAALLYMFYNLLGLTFGGIMHMYSISNMMVFFMVIATTFTDAFALFTGMAFGKHKLNERISPNKTIEGALGGFIIGSIASFTFIRLTLGTQLPLYFTIIAATSMCIVGQIGDLAFSAIKRHYGIKDFGKIFPGHGGVLDRIDSISFNSMLLYALMLLML